LTQEFENRFNELLHRTKNGDKEAQNDLFEELTVTLRPFLECRLRGYDREDKEDVLQETLITFGQKLDRIRDNPHKYAIKILRNKIGHVLRRRAHQFQISLDSDNPIPSVSKKAIERSLSIHRSSDDLLDELTRKEELNSLQNAIAALPDFCRNLFIRILKGYEREELWNQYKSTHPEMNRGAFRKRIYDCRKRLVELLTA